MILYSDKTYHQLHHIDGKAMELGLDIDVGIDIWNIETYHWNIIGLDHPARYTITQEYD